MGLRYARLSLIGCLLFSIAAPAAAGDVIGVHRWYENGSADPVISISVHDSMGICKEDIRADVREQQAAWEQTKENYRFRFSTHGCFNTQAGITDESGHFSTPEDEIYWVNPIFIVEQCRAAGGDADVCAEVTSEFIEANRNGDAIGKAQPGGVF